LRTADPSVKAAKAPAVITSRVASPATRLFDHSTGSRRGTAARVARIMPVVYSLAPSSAPSTPTARAARVLPDRARSTADVPSPEKDAEAIMPNAISRRAEIPAVIQVERNEENLVHSAATTPPAVIFIGQPRIPQRHGSGP
jgi:hypothetical protein